MMKNFMSTRLIGPRGPAPVQNYYVLINVTYSHCLCRSLYTRCFVGGSWPGKNSNFSLLLMHFQLTRRIPVDFLHILPCSWSLLFSCSSGGSHGICSNSLARVNSIFCWEVDVTWLLNCFGALWRSSTTLCNPLPLWTSVQLCPSGGFEGTGRFPFHL